MEPKINIYKNGIESFGAPITVGQLRELLIRCDDMSDETPIICSSDEEGNRFGHTYSIVHELGGPGLASDLELYDLRLKNAVREYGALIIMPAI